MPRRKERERELVTVWVVERAGRDTYVLRWNDPITGKRKERATTIPATKNKRRLAEREAQDLQDRLNASQANARELGWEVFESQYVETHLSGLAVKSRDAWKTARNHLCRIIKPATLADVDAKALAKLASTLRKEGAAETSISCYMRTIMAALRWGVRMGYIPAAPQYLQPKRAKGVTKHMRSRPITAEEFERMLLAVPKVVNRGRRRWRRLLRGLYWGGLRLGEALSLSWDTGAFKVDLTGARPVFRVFAEGEKGHHDRILPMAPEFGRMLLRCPTHKRRGSVFGIGCTVKTAGRVISRIGRKARVLVNDQGKFASAHDLRRSFGTRWAARLKPFELRELMRHRSIETTMRYYVALDAQELAEKLWGESSCDLSCDTPTGTKTLQPKSLS